MDENVLEQAELIANAMVDQAVKSIRGSIPKQPENFDGCCVECGNELQPGRVEFGAITCVPCQEMKESRQRLTQNR